MTKRQYPRVMRHWENAPVEASDGEWLSQPHAAEALDVSIWRVGLLIANGHLTPANATDGDRGVTRSSLEAEAEWRQQAGLIRRITRPIKDCFNWI